MEGKDKKKIDPGWNDPPMLKYDASNPPPKSRITNKRVAFPLSSNVTTSTQTTPLKTTTDCKCEPPILSELYKKTKNNFDKVLLTKDSNINKDTVEALLEMLKENKIDSDHQNAIYLFSKHLVDRDQEGVERLRQQLSSEFQNICLRPN